MISKKVFITGIAGFIGFHLAYALAKKGYLVFGCDNFNNYYDPKLKEKRKRKLENIGIKVIKCDISQISSLSSLFVKNNITHIVHLAAQAGVRFSLTNPQSYVNSNLDGFVQVLELCKKFSHLKLIFASSSSVYGKNVKIPFSECDQTENPISLYGATKKAGELLAKSYHHLYGISMTGLRFFTVYGPFGRPDMAYYSFAQKMLLKSPITVFNKGEMERDFTYIDDIINGTVSAIEKCNGFEIYNLGNNKPEKLMTLIYLLEKTLGIKAKIEFQPMQKGDVYKTYASIDKAQRELKFFPTTSLSEGIEKFSHWFMDSENQHLLV